MERPIRIAQHFAGEEDEVGVTFGNDGVGLLRVGDHADGGSGDGGLGADPRGEGGLKRGAYGNLRVGNLTAGGAIDQVDAMGAEMTREGNGFIDRPAAVGPIGGRDTNEEGQVGRPCGAHGVDDLKEQAYAIFEASTIGIGALIRERGKEFVEEVAVCGVDFDEIEAGGMGAMRGLGEGANDGVDAGLIEGLRHRVFVGERDGAGTDGLPTAFVGMEQTLPRERGRHGGFAAGVGELNASAHSLRVDELSDARQVGNVFVAVDAEIGGCDAAFWDHGGRLKENEACSALGAAAEVDHMPVVGEAVLRGVLAHGRNADAVGEMDRAKLKRRKERMAHDGWGRRLRWAYRNG